MPRTKGAKDKKRRKKRKFYAGRPIKRKVRNRAGNFVPYVSKRKQGDPLFVQFQAIKPMSRDGYMQWNKRIRSKIDKNIRPFLPAVYVDEERLSSPEAIEDLAIEVLGYPGVFNLLMRTGAKNTFRNTSRKKAVVKITETDEGLHATVSNYSKMKHYKFWRKG